MIRQDGLTSPEVASSRAGRAGTRTHPEPSPSRTMDVHRRGALDAERGGMSGGKGPNTRYDPATTSRPVIITGRRPSLSLNHLYHHHMQQLADPAAIS